MINERTKEYATMSRRPGIASDWIERFHKEVYVTDSVIFKGQEMMPPKYYDNKLEKLDKEKLKMIKCKRQIGMDLAKEDNTDARLDDKEVNAKAKLKLTNRRYENE